MDGLTKEECKEIIKLLDSYNNPLYFYHDDPDGVCSYLQFYKYKKGKGIIMKNTPEVTTHYLHKVKEIQPDVIIVLDLAMIEQEFIDQAKTPIIWIDHHGPFKRHNVKYYNPRTRDSHEPVSYLSYQVLQDNLWISVAGCVGDWFIPKTADKFREKYEDLLPKVINKPQDALFNTRLGEFVHIMSMLLKGQVKSVQKNIELMTQISSPYEVLDQTTETGKKLFKRFKNINKTYQELVKTALDSVNDDKILLFTYKDDKTSFTKELSNYLLYRFPEKIIVIGREKDGEHKISLRSTDTEIPPILDHIFKNINGKGGGHEHACGAVINSSDLDEFLRLLKEKV